MLWAAGILWTAADTVGFAPAADPAVELAGNDSNLANQTDATGVEVNSANLELLANVMKGN